MPFPSWYPGSWYGLALLADAAGEQGMAYAWLAAAVFFYFVGMHNRR